MTDSAQSTGLAMLRAAEREAWRLHYAAVALAVVATIAAALAVADAVAKIAAAVNAP